MNLMSSSLGTEGCRSGGAQCLNISQHVIKSMEVGSILMSTKLHLLFAVNLDIIALTVMERPTSEYIRWT